MEDIEYIKMCWKAVEIQEGWTPKKGDLAYSKTDKTIKMNGGYSGSLCDGGADGFGRWEYNRVVTLPKYNIWLPRQDQLQEMWLAGVGVIPCGLMKLFYDFMLENRTGGYILSFTSMEQLWLAFVMSERYGKVWDGKEWRKDEHRHDKANTADAPASE